MKKRLFIGIDIIASEKMNDFLLHCKNVYGKNFKWVEPQNLHITLCFIGEVGEKHEKQLTEKLKHFQFLNGQADLKGVGTFNKNNQPSILWIGIQHCETIYKLAAEIRLLVEETGLKTDYREFNPHLTIGRLHYKSKLSNIDNIIEKYHDYYFQPVEVNAFHLKWSNLTPEGPVYKNLLTVVSTSTPA